MPTSGSTNFSMTRTDMCNEAMRLIGVLDPEETASAPDMQVTVQSLNLMTKAWQAQGVFQWPRTEDTFALVSATASYLFGTGGTKTYRPLRIMSVRYVESSGNEIPLQPISREEYFDLPNKTSAGTPSCFYYDPQRASGRLYLWPVLAGTNSIKYTYIRAFEDWDSIPDEPDFPQEWFEVIAYNLAVRIAPKFLMTGKSSFAYLRAEAENMLQKAMNWDREMAPLQILPHPQYA